MDEMTYTVFITMVSILSASGSLMIIFCYLVEVEQKNVA
jgi:hypothetical protein